VNTATVKEPSVRSVKSKNKTRSKSAISLKTEKKSKERSKTPQLKDKKHIAYTSQQAFRKEFCQKQKSQSKS